MPTRNIVAILLSLFLGGICYQQAKFVRPIEPVADAFRLIDRNYVESIDRRQLMESAMRGMLAELDPYSAYISPQDYKSFQSSIEQHFAGIGIYIEMDEEAERVRVLTPLVGTPALESGIRPGDLILEVDGQDTTGMDLQAISEVLRGAPGSSVDLVVGRDGKRIDIRVQRADIPLESVTGDHRVASDQWSYRIAEEPDIAYIRLSTFGEQTAQELERALGEISPHAKGLVLDLRSNQGGLLTAAIQVCDMFLDSGRIVSTSGRASPEELIRATPGTLVPNDLPLVVLVDENSASASEIVAACLKDNGRAKVGGVRSFGKGTVQNVLPLEEGRSALKLTTARYYRPSGQNIHRAPEATEEQAWGVRPDPELAVKLTDPMRASLANRWQLAAMPYRLRQQLERQKEELAAAAAEAAEADVDEGAAATAEGDTKPSDNPSAPQPEAGENELEHRSGDDSAASDEETDGSDSTGEEPSTDTEDSGPLSDDPQLRRAVEYLLGER